MSATAPTWEDGTPRSTGNAFDIEPRPLTPDDQKKLRIREQRIREYDRKLAAQGRTRKAVTKARVTRKNRTAYLGAFAGPSKSQKAPR